MSLVFGNAFWFVYWGWGVCFILGFGVVGEAGRWVFVGYYMALGFCGRRRRGSVSFCCMESVRLVGEFEIVGKWVSFGV